MTVRSEPSGSVVSVNGVRKGNTPLSLKDIAPGKYKVAVGRPGYETWEKNIEIVSGDELTLTPTLTPRKAGLTIKSEPAGAAVSLDGKRKGKTPLTMDDVEPGEHAVVATLSDYEIWEERIEFAPGDRLERKAVLVPKDRFSAEKKQASQRFAQIMASFRKGDLEDAGKDLKQHGEFLQTYLEDGEKKSQAERLGRFFRYFAEAESAAAESPATKESLGRALERCKDAEGALQGLPGADKARVSVSRLSQKALSARNKIEMAEKAQDAYREIVSLTNDGDWKKAGAVLREKKSELAENLDRERYGHLEELETFWGRMEEAENFASKSDKVSLEKAESEFVQAKENRRPASRRHRAFQGRAGSHRRSPQDNRRFGTQREVR